MANKLYYNYLLYIVNVTIFITIFHIYFIFIAMSYWANAGNLIKYFILIAFILKLFYMGGMTWQINHITVIINLIKKYF